MRSLTKKNIFQTELAPACMASMILLAISFGCKSQEDSDNNKNSKPSDSKSKAGENIRVTRDDPSYSWESTSERINKSVRKPTDINRKRINKPFSLAERVTFETIEPAKDKKLIPRFQPNAESVASLPFWKREQAQSIDLQIQNILVAGEKEAVPIRKLSSKERREWTEKWQKRNRPALSKLRQDKQRLIMNRVAPNPTRDSVDDFLIRLSDQQPQLREEDLLIIEFLLPSELEMRQQSFLEDESYQLLKEAHKILAFRYPQSAMRESK